MVGLLTILIFFSRYDVQLLNKSTLADGGSLDLVLLDISVVAEVSVRAPTDTSEHSAISCKVKLDFRVPDNAISYQVFLKYCVNQDNIYYDIGNIQ